MDVLQGSSEERRAVTMTNTKMIEWIEQGSKVLISEDRMTAELYLCPPPENESYDTDMILQVLAKNGIKAGILEEQIKKILSEGLYYMKLAVAAGKPAQDGADGRFDFLFDTETSKKPKIMPDGSVDYRTMTNIPTVKEGAIIARYTPATEGQEGFDLSGKAIPARNGRELAEIKGKGFCTSEDKRTYMATMSGRIEMENGRISIKDFLEIKGDVDLLTGDVDFDGDVLVHGNVCGGRKIRAGGALTVEGSVEGCELYAGKDIVLARGMQGGGRGIVSCKGSLSGKFFEQTKITAGKNVNANSLLSCTVEAGEDIIVAGRHGAILGGTVYAGRVLEVTTVGNIAEVQSELVAGKSDELEKAMQKLEQDYRELQEQMEKTKHVLALLQSRRDNDSESRFSQERRMQVTRFKISLDSQMNENAQKRQSLLEKIALAQDAKIIIRQSVYPGTRVRMSGAQYFFREVLTGVTLKKKEQEIRLYSN